MKARLGLGIDRWFAPIDAASLAFFRIGFGLIMAWGVWRFFALDRIDQYFVEPSFHFTYFGFSWVRPWPAWGMQLHFACLLALTVFIAAGLFYRLCATLFFFGFSYVFLLEKARYLNHYYLVILISFLLIFIPTHRAFSLDALRKRWDGRAPAWALGLLRTQIGLVYLYAGIAKLNPDWLRGQPLLMWLPERSDHRVLGTLLATQWNAWIFSYGAVFLDLLAWPLLSFRRTRLPTFLLVVAFHLTNSAIFSIGVFPWLMIAASTIFFEPGWPLRWVGRKSVPTAPTHALQSNKLVSSTIVAYLLFQFLFPLRHFMYPGRVSWTEEGHRFSWHMKLRDKSCQVTFVLKDPVTGEHRLLDPRNELEEWQIPKMSGRPDMIHEYALHLARDGAREGELLEVRATALCSLNGRPTQFLVDPAFDLASEPRSLAPASWIVPLGESPQGEVGGDGLESLDR